MLAPSPKEEPCENRHRDLWPGGAWPANRPRTWQGHLSSESIRLLRAKSQLQEAELGVLTPGSPIVGPWANCRKWELIPPRRLQGAYGSSLETTCYVLGMFSDGPGSTCLSPEADGITPKAGAWQPSNGDMASLGLSCSFLSQPFSRQQGFIEKEF